MQKSRSAALKSIDRRAGHNSTQVTLLIVMFLIVALGTMAGFAMMEAEKLEDQRQVLLLELEAERAKNEALRDELKQRIEELETENRELRDIRKDVKEIRGILGGAREIKGATITAYAPLASDAVEGMCFSGDPNVTASGEPPVPGQTAAARGYEWGTRVFVPGRGVYRINDTGGGLGTDHFDLVVGTRREAMLDVGRYEERVLVW